MVKTSISIKKMAQNRLMYNGVPVCTTKQLAQVYGTSEKNIQMNFSRNESRFSSGKHYFYLIGDELKEFKHEPTISGVVASNVNSLYLWTERGANRHCKILDTDKAWEQFDNLEEIYFRVKDVIRQQDSPVWQDTRTYGIEIRKAETAVINEFIEYAFKNGSKNAKRYYQNYTDMANKAAGIETGKRDEASVDQLNRLSLIENIIAASIQEGIEQGIHYKKIYKACQERVNQFTEIAYITMKMPSTSKKQEEGK